MNIITFEKMIVGNRYFVIIVGVSLCQDIASHIRYVKCGLSESCVDTYTFFRPALETIILHGIYSYAIDNRS